MSCHDAMFDREWWGLPLTVISYGWGRSPMAVEWRWDDKLIWINLLWRQCVTFLRLTWKHLFLVIDAEDITGITRPGGGRSHGNALCMLLKYGLRMLPVWWFRHTNSARCDSNNDTLVPLIFLKWSCKRELDNINWTVIKVTYNCHEYNICRLWPEKNAIIKVLCAMIL